MLMMFLKVNLIKSRKSWMKSSKINKLLTMNTLKEVYNLDFMQEIQGNY
jgi:hypothetical protein